MSDQQYDQLLELLDQYRLPDNKQITPESQRVYYSGLGLLSNYRGYPGVLVQAIERFISTGVLPLALAGISNSLMLASYNQNYTYYPDGLNKAENWLNNALALAPDCFEVRLVQANLYIYRHDFPSARQLLDQLAKQGQNNFYYVTTQLSYCNLQGDLAQVDGWYNAGQRLATSDEQRLSLMDIYGRIFFKSGQYEKFISLAQQILQQNSADPWLWHNMSLAYTVLKKYPEAQTCNRNALSLMEFEAARQQEERLRKHKSWWPF